MRFLLALALLLFHVTSFAHASEFCEGQLESAKGAFEKYEASGTVDRPFRGFDLLAMYGSPEQLHDFMKAQNLDNKQGMTQALSQAVFANNLNNVRALIALGADVNGVDSNGHSVLDSAAECDAAESAALLLDAGAELYAQHQAGADALMVAIASGSKGVAQVLLDRGMDPCKNRSDAGLTSVDIATKVGWTALPMSSCPPITP